ncbi:MAG: hypothetical protein R3F55_20730 [Alphaproteobacteria bacterium]
MPSPMAGTGKAVAVALLVLAPVAARADQAGADALQADFDGLLRDIEQIFDLRVTPADPFRVAVDGAGYRVEVSAFAVGRDPSIPPAGEPGPTEIAMEVGAFAIALMPDPADPDRTRFSIDSVPAVIVTAEGAPALTMDQDSLSLRGVWSDALDQPLQVSASGTGLRATFGAAALPFGFGPASDAAMVLELATLSSSSYLIAEGDGLWRIESKARATELVSAMLVPDPDNPAAPPERTELDRIGALLSETTASGVPVLAWHDLILDWLPRLAAEEGQLDADQMRVRFAELLDALPVLFDRLVSHTQLQDVASSGSSIALHDQSVEIAGGSSEAWDIRIADTATGIQPLDIEAALDNLPGGGAPLIDLNPDLAALVATLTPTGYDSVLDLHAVPFGRAWRDLVATADVWVDEPKTAFDVFFRTFGEAALDFGTSGTLDLTVDWAESRLSVDAALAADREAALSVAGAIDAGFANMDAIGSGLTAGAGPEAGTFWLMLQALGQREPLAESGSALTRYRLEIDPDGTVTLNGIDFGPVVRTVASAFEAFSVGMVPPTLD